MHLYKQAPPGAFHNCSYLNNAPPETCNYFSRGALIGMHIFSIKICPIIIFPFLLLYRVEFPTVRQLRLWACSLHDMLTDVTGRYKFEQFCKKQYCSENIKFWQACTDLKLLPLFAIPGSVRLVYE